MNNSVRELSLSLALRFEIYEVAVSISGTRQGSTFSGILRLMTRLLAYIAFIIVFIFSPFGRAKQSEQQIIANIQKNFYTCISNEYRKNQGDLQQANKICTMSYNIAFEKQNTEFEIIRGRGDGPKNFFVEFKITRAQKTKTFQYFYGKGGPFWDCPVNAVQSTEKIKELASDITYCEDPNKKKYEDMEIPPESKYGEGFYPDGKGCTRICPDNEIFQDGKCTSCSNLITEEKKNPYNEDMTVSYAEKYIKTDKVSNICLDDKGCPPGRAFVRKDSDGSSLCEDIGCGKHGLFYTQKQGCNSDPESCKEAAADLQKGIYFPPTSAFPKTKIGKCSYEKVLEVYKKYQSEVLGKITAFETICRDIVAAKENGGEAVNPFQSFPDYLNSHCSAAYRDTFSINLPSVPQFSSDQAASYFYLGAD